MKINGNSSNDPLKDYQFNVIESPEDLNDRLVESIVPADEGSLSGEGEKWVMPRDLVKVLDQGRTSTCTGFAAAQYLRHANYKESGKLEDFSPGFTYADRADGDYEGEGDYLRNTNKQIRKNGCCLFKDFDVLSTYVETKSAYEKLSPEIKEGARIYRSKSYYRIKMWQKHTEAKKVLDKYGIILMASIPLYSSFSDSYDDGIVPIPNVETETKRGGHAVAIVGYKYIDNHLHYIIINSWGKKYGDNGFFYIPADYPWWEAWLTVDYRKLEIEIPLDPNENLTKKGMCFVNNGLVKMHAPVFIKNDRTMVPIRSISELLGYDVFWTEKTKSVRISEYLTNIYLTIGDKEIIESVTLNTMKMDVAPVIKNSRTYVPIRFVAEMMGMDVSYDKVRKYAIIKNY